MPYATTPSAGSSGGYPDKRRYYSPLTYHRTIGGRRVSLEMGKVYELDGATAAELADSGVVLIELCPDSSGSDLTRYENLCITMHVMED